MNSAERQTVLWPSLLGWLSFLCLGLGLVLLLGAGAYAGYTLYSQAQILRLVQQAAPRPAMAASQPDVAGKAAASDDGALKTEVGPEAEVSLHEAPAGASLNTFVFVSSLPRPSATHIIIPSIGVDSRIVELDVEWRDGELVWQTASHAVGHHKRTASPGESGNVVLSGHISSPIRGEGQVFKNLPKIKLGDEVFLFTEEARHRYRVVEAEVVLPTETRVMAPTPLPVLTLITCVPDFVYSHRLIVRAEPVDQKFYDGGDLADAS